MCGKVEDGNLIAFVPNESSITVHLGSGHRRRCLWGGEVETAYLRTFGCLAGCFIARTRCEHGSYYKYAQRVVETQSIENPFDLHSFKNVF